MNGSMEIPSHQRQGRERTEAALAAVPLLEHVPAAGVWWLVGGGLAYTAGVAFFVLDSRLRYSHAVWHGFVVAGTACHSVAVLGYAG